MVIFGLLQVRKIYLSLKILEMSLYTLFIYRNVGSKIILPQGGWCTLMAVRFHSTCVNIRFFAHLEKNSQCDYTMWMCKSYILLLFCSLYLMLFKELIFAHCFRKKRDLSLVYMWHIQLQFWLENLSSCVHVLFYF